MEAKAFRKLLVWKRAHGMTLLIYKITEKFPHHEMFGLTSQIRRSSASIGVNIAEGYALGSAANYLRHLHIAIGSLAETDYHVELAHDLCYLTDEEYAKLCDQLKEVGYLLSRLKSSIEYRSHQEPQTP